MNKKDDDKKCKCGCGQDLDDMVDYNYDDGYDDDNAKKSNADNDKKCNCDDDCDDDCDCNDDCEDCDHDECEHDDKCDCDDDECDCNNDDNKCDCDKDDECKCKNKDNYFQDLLRVQAEFDNYRKRMQTTISDARTDGFIDAIEQFLPAIDSFKMATEMITDKNTLMGIKFIEKGILDTLSKMGVEEIDATGKFNPELHQAIDTDSTSDLESGMITKLASRGFSYKGKVIRYAQVVVKK